MNACRIINSSLIIMISNFFNKYNMFCVKFRTCCYRNMFKKCGSFTIWGHIDVVYPKNIQIGEGCSINHGCYLNAYNPIYIGNDVTLSANVSIISTGIDIKAWMSQKKGDKHIKNEGVYVGNHVWIGANSLILSGVRISGEYVVVAAGSVVTKDITESYW